MKVTVPDKVIGERDQLFVVEVEFPVSSTERVVEVAATGPVEPLDLSGSSRGGTYRIPVGLERLHVPMRVIDHGENEASVTVTCTEGPEASKTEQRTVQLSADGASGGGGVGKRWIVGGVAVLAVAALAFFLSRGLGGPKVPDVRGMSHLEAETALRDAGFEIHAAYETPPKPEDENKVFRQIPTPGVDAPDDGIVEIVLGHTEDRLAGLPEVKGMGAEEARRLLGDDLGYQVMDSFRDVEDPTLAGKVVEMSPTAGTAVAKDSIVEIFIGRAPSTVVVPQVLELAAEEAERLLRDAGFTVAIETEVTTEIRRDGKVIGQMPAAGESAEPGQRVTLTVARGSAAPPPIDPAPVEPAPIEPAPVEPAPIEPGPIEPTPAPIEPGPAPADPALAAAFAKGDDGLISIPDMVGWTGDEARSLAGGAGLRPVVTLVAPPSPEQAGRVLYHRPSAGERRPADAMIFITVGEGVPGDAPAPTPVPSDPLPAPQDPIAPLVPPPGPDDPLPPPTPGPAPTDPSVSEVPPPSDPGPWEPAPVEPPPVEPAPVEPAPIAVAPPPSPVAPPVRRDPVAVPDTIGMSREKAEGVITQAGFRYRIVLRITDFPGDGTVLSQDPAPGGRLVPGGEVVLEVARMPTGAKLAVPSVLGKERGVAERLLRDAGFLVNVTHGGGSPDEQGRVADQAPRADAQAAPRTWVEIVVVRGDGPRRQAMGGAPRLGPASPVRPVPLGPGASGDLRRPPTVGTGPIGVPAGTPRAVAPLPPVPLPPRDAPRTATVPAVTGRSARDAIGEVLQSGLIPIIEVDRSGRAPSGQVLSTSPAAGAASLPGDLIRLRVSAGGRGTERHVDLPMAVGAEVARARALFTGSRTGVEVIEVRVPSHPYAGTGRVAAQYPVSSVPVSEAGRVVLWVILR